MILSLCFILTTGIAVAQESDGIVPLDDQVEHSEIPEALIQKVESGHAESAFFIGTAFAEGMMGIEKNIEKAKKWFLKSAEMGYVHGMFEVGKILYVDSAYDEAKVWFQKASEQGHGESFYRLSIFNLYEINGEKFDCEVAYDLLKKAQQRDVKAAFNDHAWMLSTLPDDGCRNGQKAWKVYSELQNLYAPSEAIPWAYLDTKAAVLAEIADYNEAIEIQSWIVEDFCDVDFPNDKIEFNKKISDWVLNYTDDEDPICYGAIQRLNSYVQRKPWRESPQFN